MTTKPALLLILLAALLPEGCHRETPEERGTRLLRTLQQSLFARATMETKRLAIITDSQLLQTSEANGLELAIRPQQTSLRVGESLQLRVIYKNAGARVPVAATTCQGFSLLRLEETAEAPVATALSFACPAGSMLRARNPELRPGEIRTVELTSADAPLTFQHPGRYIVSVEWRSFQAHDGLLLPADEYATLHSNPVMITVR